MTEKRVTYLLTPSQETLLLARKFSVHKSVTNFATSVIVKGVLDIPTLEKAILIGIGRWDSFGLRLEKHHREIRQYFGKQACEEIIRKDFSRKTSEQVEAFFHKEARK